MASITIHNDQEFQAALDVMFGVQSSIDPTPVGESEDTEEYDAPADGDDWGELPDEAYYEGPWHYDEAGNVVDGYAPDDPIWDDEEIWDEQLGKYEWQEPGEIDLHAMQDTMCGRIHSLPVPY